MRAENGYYDCHKRGDSDLSLQFRTSSGRMNEGLAATRGDRQIDEFLIQSLQMEYFYVIPA